MFRDKLQTIANKLKVRSWPWRQIGLAAGLIIIAGAAGFAGGRWGSQGSINAPASVEQQRRIVTSSSQLISQIANQVGPSVVSVGVTSQTSQTDFFGLSHPTTQRSAGTGIIINKEGLIITNRHVVPAGTTSVSVTLSDGTKFDDVKVIGRTSQSSSLDIAFLKISDTKGKQLTPAVLGDSGDMEVGAKVVAIGNALGQFQNTITSGIISGHNRSITATGENGQSAEHLSDLFQTDAAINHGNSGGPLVNMNGEVIGINTAIAGQAENIGFAIPINNVKGLIKSVERTGELKQPYLGVRYIALTPDYAYVYNLPVDHGAYIAPSQGGQPSVIPGSPADQAGLQEKDIILKVDGQTVGQSNDLASLLGKHQVGDMVQLTVRRGDKTIAVNVTLGEMPKKQ